jgi:hypothetical protein
VRERKAEESTIRPWKFGNKNPSKNRSGKRNVREIGELVAHNDCSSDKKQKKKTKKEGNACPTCIFEIYLFLGSALNKRFSNYNIGSFKVHIAWGRRSFQYI